MPVDERARFQLPHAQSLRLLVALGLVCERDQLAIDFGRERACELERIALASAQDSGSAK